MAENVPAAAPPALPDYLKKYVETTKVGEEADSMASASISIPRISLRAKKFRFIEGGEEIAAETETDLVIVAVDPGPGKFVKTYYEGTYNSGDSAPPTCSSSDGIKPDNWVTTPQNPVCATCPKNVFGSATSRTGKKAKACRDAKRLWTVRPNAIDGTVYGLNVPVTSLKNLAELGQTLKGFNVPISAAVIHFTMEDDESFPILKFGITGWLKQEFGELAINRNLARDWQGAVPLALPAPAAQPQIGAPASSAAPANPAVTATMTTTPPTQKAEPQTIEGQAQPAKSNDVNEALKNWT